MLQPRPPPTAVAAFSVLKLQCPEQFATHRGLCVPLVPELPQGQSDAERSTGRLYLPPAGGGWGKGAERGLLVIPGGD